MNANDSCYIVNVQGGLKSVYYDDGSIIMKNYENDEWRVGEEIVQGVTARFSLNVSEKGEIFIFCQDKSGDIKLCHNDGTKWSNRIIQKNLENKIYNIQFFSIIKDENIYLFYNVPSEISRGSEQYKIIFQEMTAGVWGKSVTIAENVSDSNPVFTIQYIKESHYVLYYQTSSRENFFGYKEYYIPDKWGSFMSMHQSAYKFVDNSVITTVAGIYSAFVIKGSHSCQLVFRAKTSAEIGSPLVLFESGRIDNVTVMMHKNILYITFSAGPYGYYLITSNDGGKTFGRPQRLNNRGSAQLIKASYISVKAGEPEKSVINDIFVDMNSPGNAPFLTQIYPEFYSEQSSLAPVSNTAKTETISSGRDEKYEELKDKFNESTQRAAILENRLESAYKELEEKNKQIMALRGQLSNKNEEISESNRNWRSMADRLQRELEAAKKEQAKSVEAKKEQIKSVEKKKESAQVEEAKSENEETAELENEILQGAEKGDITVNEIAAPSETVFVEDMSKPVEETADETDA